MRCPNCSTSNPPNAKFCMECGIQLLVCPNCSTANFITAKFCIECGISLSVKPLTDRDTVPLAQASALSISPNGQPSRAAETQTQTLTAPEERRVVTIMFADITGSTPLADRLDPEDMRAILAGYFNLMAEQIRRHGGTVEKYIGDAVMAVFGAPIAHEDDPDRAIRAALDMQTALKNFNAMRQGRDSEATYLQMRIGINTGEVAAPGAQFQRRDFLITGDAVNVAARLQQVAQPDTILVGERTYLATRSVFEFRSLAPVIVKGKTAPLNAWAVAGFRSQDLTVVHHPRGIEGLESPLVGRSLELTLMHATYARVRDAHHSHLITLLGTPGVGKSRLVHEFINREIETARCTTCDDEQVEPLVLQGRCPPYGEGITYWPLIEIFRELIRVREGESGETLEVRFKDFVREAMRKAKRSEDIEQVTNVLLQRIGPGLRGDTTPHERREIQRSKLNKDTDKGGPEAALQRACRILLEAIAHTTSLILIIDDLHWADDALLKLLEYLAVRITDFSLLFIFMARADFLERRRDWGGGQPNFTTIILDALSRNETTELICQLLATDELPDALLHTIQQRAEGNPFFVEEIVHMLIDQNVLVKIDGTWRISEQSEDALSDLASPATPPEDTLIDQHYVLPLPRLPDTIQGVLAARIDLLSPIEKQIVQDASIVGRTFWVSAVIELAEGLESDVVLQTLESLARHDFIEESEKQTPGPIVSEQSFSFKHILIRDVVYYNLPRIRRSQKHAQLAFWLEQQVADRLEDFAELLAYHSQQALTYWPAKLHAQTLSFQEHEADQEDEKKASGSLHLTRSELVQRAVRYLTLAGDRAYRSYYTIRAIQAYSEALDLLRENDYDALTIAKMHQKLGHAYTQRANADEAWNEYTKALALIKDQPEASKKDLLSLYVHLSELAGRWLGWFNKWLDMNEVRSYIDAGLKLIEGEPPSCTLSSFLTYQAMWYIHQTKYAPPEQRVELAENALQSALEARRIAEEIHDHNALWIALDALGFVYDKQNKYSEGHIIQHQRQELRDMIREREELYDLYSSLGWNHERISDYPTAANWLGQAWRIAQTMESPSMLLYSLYSRLVVWSQWNRWDEAREVAQLLLQTSEQYQQEETWQLRALTALLLLAYRTGDLEESERLLQCYQRISGEDDLDAQIPASLAMLRGEWSLALAKLREQSKTSELFPSPETVSYIAELTVLAREPLAEQVETCERAMLQAEQSGARKFLGIALRARGRMHMGQAQLSEAEQDFRRALEIFKELDLPWEQGETLYCLGHLYQNQADQGGSAQAARAAASGLARFFFEQALGFFESLHAVHDIQRVRDALTEEIVRI